MTYDIVIRNGEVIDGTNREPFRADVAVDKGRIVEVGRIESQGREELDATGCYVTPGFIDGHTHMDAQVMWDPLGTCSSWHGVTTVVMGNCGFTLAPGSAEKRDLVIRNIERAEDISRASLEAGIEWTWETFPEYLDAIERRPLGINYASNIGHSSLRTWAMGERAFQETATEDDLRAMEAQLAAALDAGAIGFTTSRNRAHLTTADTPVASRFADWDEVRRLVGVLGKRGRGIFELAVGLAAVGDEGDELAAYGRAFDLSSETGVPVTMGMSGSSDDRLAQLSAADHARTRGARIMTQTHSRGVANVLSFKSAMPFDVLPGWKAVRSLPIQDQLAAFAHEERRRELILEAQTGTYGAPVGTEPSRPNYDRMLVLKNPIPPNPTVADLAASRGVSPEDLILDLAIETGGNQFFFQPLTQLEPQKQLQTLLHPHTAMTFSDSGAHVGQIMDASIQTHLLAHWVRSRQEITWPMAIEMMTSRIADFWGFNDRGRVRQGGIADLNIIDPDMVGPRLPEVVNDLPGGTIRLRQGAEGIRATLVSGQILFVDGEHTGEYPGSLIRTAGAHTR